MKRDADIRVTIEASMKFARPIAAHVANLFGRSGAEIENHPRGTVVEVVVISLEDAEKLGAEGELQDRFLNSYEKRLAHLESEADQVERQLQDVSDRAQFATNTVLELTKRVKRLEPGEDPQT